MKKMIVVLVSWYVQDLLQIMMTQTFLPPEVYALSLIWAATQPDEIERPWCWFAAAVVGGILMDLRWIGVPGLCGALYSAVVLAARAAWRQIPEDSRHMAPFTVISAALALALTPFRLVFWDPRVLSGRIVQIVSAQWLSTAVALLLFAISRPYSHDEL